MPKREKREEKKRADCALESEKKGGKGKGEERSRVDEHIGADCDAVFFTLKGVT